MVELDLVWVLHLSIIIIMVKIIISLEPAAITTVPAILSYSDWKSAHTLEDYTDTLQYCNNIKRIIMRLVEYHIYSNRMQGSHSS